MKKTETIYKCDLCGFEKKQKDIVEFTVDNGYDMSGSPSMSFLYREICVSCLELANKAFKKKV